MSAEDSRHAQIMSLIFEIDFRDPRPVLNFQKIHALTEEITNAMKRPNFVAFFLQLIEEYLMQRASLLGPKPVEEFLTFFYRSVKLSSLQILVTGFALARSQNAAISIEGRKVIRAKLPEIVQAKFGEVSEELLYQFLHYLSISEDILPDAYAQIIGALRSSSLPLVYPTLLPRLSEVKDFQARSNQARLTTYLLERGSNCSQSVDLFRSTIRSSGIPLNEDQVADMLVVFICKATEADSSEKQWNLEVIKDTLAVECKGMNWTQVVRSLDHPILTFRNDITFQILTTMIIRISAAPLPAAGLMGLWRNRQAQLELIVRCSQLPANKVDFSSLVAADQQLPEVPVPPNLAWMCIPVYHTLMQLASNGLTMEVLEALKPVAANYPEYLMICLCQTQDAGGGLRLEMLRKILPLFSGLKGSRSTSFVVMKKLASVSPDVLVSLLRFSLKRARSLSEVIEFELRLKSLGMGIARRVEEESTLDEILSLLCVRADRGEIILDEKLRAYVDRNPQNAKVMLAFVKEHLEALRPRSTDGGVLSVECLQSILKEAQLHPNVVSIDEIRGYYNTLTHFQQQYASTHAPVQQMHANATAQPAAQKSGSGVSEDVENEANAYFQKIYTSELSIPDVIALLKKFKMSPDKREQDIFRCMIHNLFDEYRFFHKYPDKELELTGTLFGALIQNQLVASMTLGITLRYIIEALRKDPELGVNNEKMFRFGKIALEQFRSRLSDWPQYCTHLIQIAHLGKHSSELLRDAKEALGNSTGSGVGDMGMDSGSGVSDIAHSLQQVALDDKTVPIEPVQVPRMQPEAPPPPKPSIIDQHLVVNVDLVVGNPPPDNVRDKVQMIFNNIDKVNQDAKTVELKSLLLPDYFSWFADFLVKRIGSQQNLHPLYLSILDAIDSALLHKTILDAVYNSATKFLASSKIVSSSSERQILRNLGIWIGATTLARNKPILQRRLSLKALLFWGYETGRLIAVCSFVARILEGVKESKVFRPPNPWLMAILGVMRELFDMEDLKMHVKFEVQVLCRNINVRIEDIPKENLLPSCRQPIKDSSNPDFNSKAPAPAQSPVLTGKPMEEVEEPVQPTKPALPLSLPSIPPAGSGSTDLSQEQTVIPNLPNFLVINPSLQFFTSNPAQKRLVSLAVDRAIRELIQPVAERSATIAGVTAKMIILKDFATESNEQLLRHHAHLMISNLAGSLALVTCKEPLRMSICNHLRTLLSQATNDQNLIEQICQVCSHDNLDIGCMVIEKAAMEKAIQEVDEALSSAYQTRRKQRELGQPYSDPTAAPKGSKYPNELPDFLRPRTGGLTSQQLTVYEAFQRPRTTPSTQTASSPVVTSANGPQVADLKPLPPAGQAPLISLQQSQEAYQQVFSRLDQALRTLIAQAQGREISISMLGNNTELLMLLREFRLITERTQVVSRQDSCLTFAEKIFKRLLESIGSIEPIRAEAMILVLEALRDEKSNDPKRLSNDMVTWLNNYSTFNVNDENAKKMLRSVLVLCLRAKLLRSQDIDAYFATFMDSGRLVVWVDLALEFVKLCLSERLAATYEFPKIFDTVSKIRNGTATFRKQLQNTLTELKALALETQKSPEAPVTTAPVPSAVSKETAAIREQVTVLLERWLRVWTSITETTFTQYLHNMHQYGVLKTEEAADKFFRVATELCIEHCLKSGQNSPANAETAPALQFTVMDALSKLFILLMRQADRESTDVSVRANLLNRILAAITRTLITDYEAKKNQRLPFDQRPYFRILSSLSSDLGVADPKKEVNAALNPLLSSYYQIFSALQPINVPGFAFAWVQLISHRTFLPHLLLIKGQRGWAMAYRLISYLLIFMHPFLKASQLNDVVRKLYKATLRIMLLLLHDFPEFLCEYHLSLCDLIPTSCVQMRNLVLSAFPRSMRLPDPFNPNLKADLIPEINQPPRIQADYFNTLNERGFRQRIENYMTTKTPADLPTTIVQQLVVSGGINMPLMNSLIIFVGSLGVIQLQNKISLPNSPAMDFYRALLHSLDYEGRYYVLNCIANQLRYPNSHTHYFSYVMLLLFAEADTEFLQEQITRVLLERLIVNRPHPWGLLITFIELIKNPRYAFWTKGFTRCAPEIERVFESVARSCISGNAASGSNAQAATTGLANGGSASSLGTSANSPSLTSSTPGVSSAAPGR